MGTLTIYHPEGETIINDVPLDSVRIWVERTAVFTHVNGYKFEVKY